MELKFLYSLSAESYLSDVSKILKITLSTLNKICYISLNKSAEAIIDFCKKNDIDTSKVIIIDMISPRFRKCTNKKGIIYPEVNDLEEGLNSILKIIKKEKCDSLIFDSLSTLEIYYEPKDFIKFIHKLLVYSEDRHIITNLIIQKKDMQKEWVNSLKPLTGKPKEVLFSS